MKSRTLACIDVDLAVAGRTLCRGLNIRFEPGQVWAVLGRNGTGKSTLIHALAGLARPGAGRVELDGTPLERIHPMERARSVGVLLQLEEGAYWGSVSEYVLLGRFPHAAGLAGYTRDDADEASAALEHMRLADYAGRRVASLSGGERQRVRIAQILAQAPDVFLLDEPLQHLDLAHQAHVLTLIASRARDRRKTVLMVLHEPLWIGRACTHALIFSGDGEVVGGPAADLLTRERLERAYGCPLSEVAHGEGRCFVPNV
jgi:iron complex transport system ATP-binding protein